VEEVGKLKQGSSRAKTSSSTGSARLVQTLIEHDLFDELA